MGITYQASDASGASSLTNYFAGLNDYISRDAPSGTVLLNFCFKGGDPYQASVFFITSVDPMDPAVLYIGHIVVDDEGNLGFEIEGTLSGRIADTVTGTETDLENYMANDLTREIFTVEGLFKEDDDLTGNVSANVLRGFGGSDRIDGSYGDDHLFGDTGADVLLGGYGNDLLDGGTEDDTLNGGDGDDAIYAGDGDDRLAGGRGADVLDGGAGFDFLSYAANAAAVTLTIGQGVAKGGDAEGDRLISIDYVVGSRFADRLTGSAAADTLNGFDGNDRLAGGGGDDILIGSAGADRLDGGAGRDTASYAAGNLAGVTIDLAAGTSVGGHATGDVLISIENVTGTVFADQLTGSDADNVLDGDLGADTLTGGAGDDLLIGQDGDDVLTGGTGRDVFRFGAASGTDTITDWRDGLDRIGFAGGQVDSFADLTIRNVAGVATITSADGTIRVEGARAGQFTAADFQFGTATAPLDAADRIWASPPPAYGHDLYVMLV